MPWLAPWPDAPDSHRLWADPGSLHERALRASGFDAEVPAPGSGGQDSAVLLIDLPEGEEPEEDDAAP